MLRTAAALRVPVWVLLVASVLLFALFTQLRPVLAPALTQVPASSNVQAEPSSPAADAGAIAPRTIAVSRPAAPIAVAPATAPQVPEAPASAQCPAQPGSGLPCMGP
jgi:hypothetical protein